MQTDAVVFDAYGTLFDVRSVQQETEQRFPGHGDAITGTWRRKQLEYTWLRSLMNRYKPFSGVTRDALVYAIKSRGLAPEESQIDDLMSAYLRLTAFPEARQALEQLAGRQRAILTNGDLPLIEPAVKAAGLNDVLDAILTVDTIRIYKPNPQAYALVTEHLGVDAQRVLFVSSNPFDVVGATQFGFRVAWIKRAGGQMDELDAKPAHTVETLTELLSLVD
ncbi:MAG: haloacid dehalogenase type II [Ectothiorhodospiraceae bacterium]|nr:haloacid dehalogenase type II [Ectothiorhodospiraceae bacterium]